MKKIWFGIIAALICVVTASSASAQTITLHEPSQNSTCAELQAMIDEAQWGINVFNGVINVKYTELEHQRAHLANVQLQLMIAQTLGPDTLIPQLQAAIYNTQNNINSLNAAFQYAFNMKMYYMQLLIGAQQFYASKGC